MRTDVPMVHFNGAANNCLRGGLTFDVAKREARTVHFGIIKFGTRNGFKIQIQDVLYLHTLKICRVKIMAKFDKRERERAERSNQISFFRQPFMRRQREVITKTRGGAD